MFRSHRRFVRMTAAFGGGAAGVPSLQHGLVPSGREVSQAAIWESEVVRPPHPLDQGASGLGDILHQHLMWYARHVVVLPRVRSDLVAHSCQFIQLRTIKETHRWQVEAFGADPADHRLIAQSDQAGVDEETGTDAQVAQDACPNEVVAESIIGAHAEVRLVDASAQHALHRFAVTDEGVRSREVVHHAVQRPKLVGEGVVDVEELHPRCPERLFGGTA